MYLLNLNKELIMDTPLFTGTGPSTPKNGLGFEDRNAVVAVVRNPNTQEYLILNWIGGAEQITFITGGIETGQTAEEAARSEVKEETGYIDLKLVSELPRYNAEFFHTQKNINRRAFFQCFLFELIDEAKQEVSASENAKHTSNWMSLNDLNEANLEEGFRFLLDHIIQNEL